MLSITSGLLDNTSMAASTVVVLMLIVTTFLVLELYNFLRLRHILGPRSAFSTTKLWMLRRALGGRWHLDLKEVSDKFRPLVRIAADELLCTDPDVLRRMSGVRSEYSKGRFYEAARFRPGVENLVSMRDEKRHKELRERIKPTLSNLHSPTPFQYLYPFQCPYSIACRYDVALTAFARSSIALTL